ncbi:MAG: WD40 repeat domain-containing protein [Treponema sp.]|jgi:hypothetical protein|nr:WD40 repeat domain-containing protein [Treponema sp.]
MRCSLAINIVLIVFLALPASSCVSAQSFSSSRVLTGEVFAPGPHEGAVNALVLDAKNQLLSVGEDGFLEIWDIRNKTALERFELSPYAISCMALRPDKTQVAVVDHDATGAYRVSVWDYAAKKKLFTQGFRDSIAYINYSAGGNIIIAAWGTMSGVVFIQAENGELIQAPEISGVVTLACTGRSERSMVIYQPVGAISYWDLNSGKEMQRFNAPAQLRSPILFGNNRFLGGLDQSGVVILDAVSGVILFRERLTAQGGILLPVSHESAECVYLALNSYSSTVYHFAISSEGQLETKRRVPIPLSFSSITSALILEDGAALGTADGKVWLGSQTGTTTKLNTKRQLKLTELAVSASTLGFLSNERSMGFIPLDYKHLKNNTPIQLEEEVPYTAITGDMGRFGETRFVLWQSANTRLAPLIRLMGEGNVSVSELSVETLPRASLRDASLYGEKALFLDSAGNITVVSAANGDRLFSFSVIGALDVAFLNDSAILVGRSAVSGDTPFLEIDIVTGETVPIAYPSAVGLKVYGGASGMFYGAALGQNARGLSTVLVQLNINSPELSTKLFEAPGEHTAFDIVETDSIAASNLGSEGAYYYATSGAMPFERSPGFPTRLVDSDAYFVSVDADGSIAWHEPASGKLLALLRLYEDSWLLEKADGEVLRGSVEIIPMRQVPAPSAVILPDVTEPEPAYSLEKPTN